MRLYQGHILAAVAIGFGLLAVGTGWLYFTQVKAHPESWWVFMLFGVAVLSGITSVTSAAMAYVHWVPRWEREEKRTGKVPGEKGKQ